MKKLIALILALVLILSMSVCVSAVDLPASMNYYVRLINCLEDPDFEFEDYGVWYYVQPQSDTVEIPESLDTTEELQAYFHNHVQENWTCCYLDKLDEELFAGLNPGVVGDSTGVFIVCAVFYYSDNSCGVYPIALLNANNGMNGCEIYMYDTGFEGDYIQNKIGYFNDRKKTEDFFVFGSRGEQTTTGDVISVDLEWGSMEFVYTPEQTIWNPDTHEYETVLNEDGSSAAGWSVAEGSSNHIAITNHSNVPVEAVLEFASAEGKNINGYFGNRILSCDSAAELAYNSPEKAPSDSTVFNIIRCEIDEETQGELGTITVTIRHREA